MGVICFHLYSFGEFNMQSNLFLLLKIREVTFPTVSSYTQKQTKIHFSLLLDNKAHAINARRFNDEIDKLTGYKTKSLLCMPIRSSDGEIIGVAQAINKIPEGAPFTEDDEKARLRAFCDLYFSS